MPGRTTFRPDIGPARAESCGNSMKAASDSQTDFEALQQGTLYPWLSTKNRGFVRTVACSWRLTHQEVRLVAEYARDLEMWQAPSIVELWDEIDRSLSPELSGRARKKALLAGVQRRMTELRHEPKCYSSEPLPAPARTPAAIVSEHSARNVIGVCPVCSEKTVCCGLRTIDAVMNCAYGCRYCTIQTFYEDAERPAQRIVVDADLGEKLRKEVLDPGRFYHFGSGQASDSLAWGNPCGILDELCAFAAAHPNVLLELKTKSANVDYVVEHRIPSNVVCSFSLNTETIIKNEEHFTASLEARLAAARRAADAGVRVAFHFHPLVWYDGWEQEYRALAESVRTLFAPEEVLFVSFGTVTFIKPVLREIRRRGGATKILQMEMVADPHGKLTYPDEIKLQLYRAMNDALHEWHGKVFLYLCMERAEIWDALWGRHYGSTEEFLEEFGRGVGQKIGWNSPASCRQGQA